MNKITFCGKIDGISIEQIVRLGQYNMKVKHFHSQYELFYIIEGERQFFFNNRQHTATSGDLILIDTNLIHMTKSRSNEDHGYNRVILYIDQVQMQEFDRQYPELGLVQFFHQNYGVYHLTKDQQSSFLNLYRDIRLSLTNKEKGYKTGITLNVLSWLYKIMHQLSIEERIEPPISESNKVKNVYKVCDYLSQNCEQNISLDELAAHFYLSKYYLCRIFKEITNYTIKEYVNIHRILKAKNLLENTSLSISDISYQLGFDSLTYFEKIFKTHMNMSPLRYRKTRDTVILNEEVLTILDDTTFLIRDGI
ncbi:MAG: AraC family transcriptional regulator [bacterium]|nr:AraC family transcriptional regulator [bacterium]